MRGVGAHLVHPLIPGAGLLLRPRHADAVLRAEVRARQHDVVRPEQLRHDRHQARVQRHKVRRHLLGWEGELDRRAHVVAAAVRRRAADRGVVLGRVGLREVLLVDRRVLR